MDYLKHYEKLISKAKMRDYDQLEYYETHHILPVCMGGTDDGTNLVKLFGREHYLAHLLLAKIYPNNDSLIYAVVMMANNEKWPGRTNNKLYEWVRRKHSAFMTFRVRDTWAKKYGYKDIDDQKLSIWKLFTENQLTTDQMIELTGVPGVNIRRCLNLYASENNLTQQLADIDFRNKSLGQKVARNNFTPEQEKRRIAAVKNMDYSARTIKTGPRDGSNNPVFGLSWVHEKKICPHCGILAGGKRWHFDNCRKKT